MARDEALKVIAEWWPALAPDAAVRLALAGDPFLLRKEAERCWLPLREKYLLAAQAYEAIRK